MWELLFRSKPLLEAEKELPPIPLDANSSGTPKEWKILLSGWFYVFWVGKGMEKLEFQNPPAPHLLVRYTHPIAKQISEAWSAWFVALPGVGTDENMLEDYPHVGWVAFLKTFPSKEMTWNQNMIYRSFRSCHRVCCEILPIFVEGLENLKRLGKKIFLWLLWTSFGFLPRDLGEVKPNLTCAGFFSDGCFLTVGQWLIGGLGPGGLDMWDPQTWKGLGFVMDSNPQPLRPKTTNYSSWFSSSKKKWLSDPLKNVKWPATEGSKGHEYHSRWWQLKDFWNFHPDPWGNRLQFDFRILFGWVVQPPTTITGCYHDPPGHSSPCFCWGPFF